MSWMDGFLVAAVVAVEGIAFLAFLTQYLVYSLTELWRAIVRLRRKLVAPTYRRRVPRTTRRNLDRSLANKPRAGSSRKNPCPAGWWPAAAGPVAFGRLDGRLQPCSRSLAAAARDRWRGESEFGD